MKPITTFRNANLGITVHVTMPAQEAMGSHNVIGAVKTLTDMAAALSAQSVRVYKDGPYLAVTFYCKDGWTGTMKVKR